MKLHREEPLRTLRPIARGVFVLLLVAGASSCAIRQTHPTGLSPVDAGPESSHRNQILVTLEPAAVRPLGAAGSTARPYPGPSRYTVSERTRRTVARLSKDYGLRQVDGWPIQALGIHCVVFEIAPGIPTEDLLERLTQDPRVESAQPMHVFELQGSTYNDPYAEMQHGLEAMRVWDAHPWARGRGVTVAIVDTAVERRHPDLSGNIAMTKDFVGQAVRGGKPGAEPHGTAVAGVIAAVADNDIGTVGVAPDARILALRACWQASGSDSPGHCNSFTLAKALTWVVEQRPDVLNLSFAGPHDPLLERLIRAALDEHVTVVTAYQQNSDGIAFPGSVDGVLVAQSSSQPSSAKLSEVTVAAPANEILAAALDGGFDFVSGSSFAAAHVSGVVALLLERAPDLSSEQIGRVLRETSRRSSIDDRTVVPVIDACAALARVAPENACSSLASS